MPFASEFDEVYQNGVKAGAFAAGVDCQRVDEQIFAEGILSRIYAEIARADLIIADMTGCNPNVFYEVGFAHALNKPVILITHAATDIPLDLKHAQHIIYGNDITRLRTQLATAIRHYLKPKFAKRSDCHVPKVRHFDTLAALYSYIIEQMQRSRQIDDLSWGSSPMQERSWADHEGYERYLAAKLQVCQKADVTYREVFTFPTKYRLAKALAHIDRDYYGYSVCYYPSTATDHLPRFSFMLFDAEEVVVAFATGGIRVSHTEIRLSITEPHIVAMFCDYYNSIYEGGIWLKDADQFNQVELVRLREVLRNWSE